MKQLWWIPLTLALISWSGAQTSGNLSDLCVVCHTDMTDRLKKGGHWAAWNQTNSQGRVGCETCHWPGGQRHIEDPSQAIFAFGSEDARERSERCRSCHRQMGSRHGVHERAGIACDDCHVSGHGEEPFAPQRLLSGKDPALCLDCHEAQRAQMQLPFRHRTSDGTLKCADCHNPHARFSARTIKLASSHACFGCHTDKQGPFAFEHQVSTIQGCESCHEPHGSTNPRLLIRSQVRFLCLECHTGVPAQHNLADPRYQNCTLCHRAIHGSHVDEKLFR